MKGNTMLKIHILGGPGSGKTTLGECLSSRFHVPHYDLDQIGWKLNDMAEYIDTAFALAKQPGWVTENIGVIWTDPLLYQADCIVLLEVSWPVVAWRILRRHISKSLAGTNPYPTKLLFHFLKDTRRYYLNKTNPDTVKAIRAYITEHEESVEPPDADLLLIRLEKYEMGELPGVPPTAKFTRKYLEKYKEKVILVRTNADRERLLDLLTQHR